MRANEVHRVVIVGGGFAGLRVAKSLGGAAVQVTLLDRRNHHVFQPLLYQVATGMLSPANIATPLRSVLGRQTNVEVLLEEVVDFDVAGRRVRCRDRDFPYDTLILAAGVRHHYFGRDDWERFAPGLKSLEDATTIRRRILYAFEAAELEDDPAARDAVADIRGGRCRPHRRRDGRCHRRARPNRSCPVSSEGLPRSSHGYCCSRAGRVSCRRSRRSSPVPP